MNSIQINIKATEEEQELFISELSDLGAEGFEQTENELIAYFPENNFPAYDIEVLLKETDHRVTTLRETNWNALWESNFQPVVVDHFCGIRAEFHSPLPSLPYEIILTPKMSFGTGHHATTYMMISQMREIDFKNKKVFATYTGSGASNYI